jgi:membrane protein
MQRAGAAWISDNASSMGAALAFYSAFALAPLLLILSAVVGMVFGAARARHALLAQASGLIGPVGSEAVRQLLDQTSRASSDLVASAVGLVLMMVGASSVMVELQVDLDRIWHAPPRDNSRPWWALLRERLAAFVLVSGFGVLLLISMIAGTALNAAVNHSAFAQHAVLLRLLHLVVTLIVFSLLFAMLFKWLPNVRLGWRDVWRGAVVTALLFTLGQLGIGYYLGHSTTTSAYAAAASLLVLLLWLYYAAQIFLFGAEYVWVYVQRHRPAGAQLPPRH